MIGIDHIPENKVTIKLMKYIQDNDLVNEEFKAGAKALEPKKPKEPLVAWFHRLNIFLGKIITIDREGNDDSYSPEIVDGRVKFNNFIDTEFVSA